eukprot:6192659-Pleurochrysis_carterae.AAC.3
MGVSRRGGVSSLRKSWEAASQRVDGVLRIELLQLLVEPGRVAVPILLLERLGSGRNGLHLGGRLDLLLGKREGQRLHACGQMTAPARELRNMGKASTTQSAQRETTIDCSPM